MRTFILCFVAAFGLSAASATAQTYPSQSETPITDDAELLSPVQEAELAERIVELEQETDSDIAVVTLPATQFYTMGDDIDVYAQGLIEDWDMAGPSANRYVLLLIFRDDRELAIEIGGSYGIEGSVVAATIIQEAITPAFREDDYPAGIRAGIEAIAAQVLSPPAATPDATATAADTTTDTTSTETEGGSNMLLYIGGGIAALIAVVVGANRRSAAKLAATPCPSCGKAGQLSKERVTVREASETSEGRGETRTTCGACGHVEAEPYTISKKKPKEDDDDKKGGGAKGEW